MGLVVKELVTARNFPFRADALTIFLAAASAGR